MMYKRRTSLVSSHRKGEQSERRTRQVSRVFFIEGHKSCAESEGKIRTDGQ
jgi:hypothetical protein